MVGDASQDDTVKPHTHQGVIQPVVINAVMIEKLVTELKYLAVKLQSGGAACNTNRTKLAQEDHVIVHPFVVRAYH